MTVFSSEFAPNCLRIVLLLACVRLALANVQYLHWRLRLRAESARKLLHAHVGLIFCLSPLLFNRVWPVAACLGLLAVLLLLRGRFEAFGRHTAKILDGVERRTIGDFCYAAGICLLFILSHADPLLFCVPLLILSLADAAAAIVGTRYGATRYRTFGGTKSLEGSFAFGAVAFVITFVALAAAERSHVAAAMLISLIAAILLTGIEALADAGLDNLLLPLAAWGILKTLLGVEAYDLQLIAGFLAAAILLAAMRPWRNATRRIHAAASGAFTHQAESRSATRPAGGIRWRRHDVYQSGTRATQASTAAGGLPSAPLPLAGVQSDDMTRRGTNHLDVY